MYVCACVHMYPCLCSYVRMLFDLGINTQYPANAALLVSYKATSMFIVIYAAAERWSEESDTPTTSNRCRFSSVVEFRVFWKP